MLSNLIALFIFAILLVFFVPWFLMHIFWFAGALFWLWMLIDCVTRKFKNDTMKIVWTLIIIFLPFLGSLIYFFFVKLGSRK